MLTGKVKWFSETKGYGFIIEEGSEREIFVHHSEIKMKGYRKLEAGEVVSFDEAEGQKGPKAVNVAVLDPGGP